MRRPHLQVLAVVVALVALLGSAALLFTDPSDISYECPAATWTLIAEPAPPDPGSGDFFDAGAACNRAAAERFRTAAVTSLSALLLLLALNAAGLVSRSAHNPPLVQEARVGGPTDHP